VTGTITDGSWTVALLGDRATFNVATNPAPQVGRYTLVIPGVTNVVTNPAGDSYAFVTVASNGLITASGRLCDNVGFVQSVALSKNGQWPFYASPYNNRGALIGWLQFTNASDTSLDGQVNWSKTAFTTTYYPAGFDVVTTVLGSTYTAPADGERVVAVTNGLLVFDGGELYNAPLFTGGYFDTNNTASFTNGATLRLASVNTGAFTGAFVHNFFFQRKAIYGVALQQQEVVRGYFLGFSKAGSFVLTNN
jgi:hypothetical protein